MDFRVRQDTVKRTAVMAMLLGIWRIVERTVRDYIAILLAVSVSYEADQMTTQHSPMLFVTDRSKTSGTGGLC